MRANPERAAFAYSPVEPRTQTLQELLNSLNKALVYHDECLEASAPLVTIHYNVYWAEACCTVMDTGADNPAQDPPYLR